jgi:hypothetical protein
MEDAVAKLDRYLSSTGSKPAITVAGLHQG